MIAAASAARHWNHDVVVYEEHKTLGLPEQCGGLLSNTAIEWFNKLGVRTSTSLLNRIDIAVLHAGNISVSAKVNAQVIRRSLFDRACADFAESKGVEIRKGKRLTEQQIIRLAKGSVPNSSNYVIGADGPFSTTASAFDFPQLKHVAAAMQMNVDRMKLDKNKFHAFFFKDSFGWIIPMNRHSARVGLAFFKKNRNAKATFDVFLRSITKGYGGKPAPRSFFADCVPYAIRNQIQKDKVCLVGDAAGQAKATSLGGVYYGCRSAWIAGQTLEDGADNYENRWKKEIKQDLHFHGVARQMMNSNAAVISSLLALKTLEKMGIYLRYDMEKISSLSVFRM